MVDISYIYSFVTRPLIVSVREMIEYGFSEQQVRDELTYALRRGVADATERKNKSDVGA